MATANLTKRTVDAAKAGTKDVFLWDDEVRGFGLKVTPKGSKIFVLQYRMGGRGAPTRRYTIGSYGSPWTPQGAREEAKRLLTSVDKGTDPIQEKADRLRVATDLAFDACADRFLEQYVSREWKKSYGFAESILRKHVRKKLNKKPLPSISKSDLSAVLDAIPADQPALRRNVYAVIRRLFRWAKGRGDITINPLEDFEAPASAASRDRVLSDAELRLVWVAAGKLGYPFASYFRLLAGTGARREEVASLPWKELNRTNATWTLPADRAKNGIATVIHLSPPMIAELDGVAGGEKWPRRGYVLSTVEDRPVSGFSRAKARLDKAMVEMARAEAEEAGDDPERVEVDRWRVHDLRRTLATGMQRLGVRFEVTEALLNHVSGSRSGVAGVYQRYSWEAERKAALDAWAAHIERLVSGVEETNVVQLAARA